MCVEIYGMTLVIMSSLDAPLLKPLWDHPFSGKRNGTFLILGISAYQHMLQ
jgi:hypothetical protein